MNRDLSTRPELRPRGVFVFAIVWVGQLISAIGSGLTWFGLSAWLFQESGSATQFALNSFLYVVPIALVASIAGTLVDRWDRRRVMILADTGQALLTLVIALLLYADQLKVWHIYSATIMSAVAKSFQDPAYAASVSLLVPRRHLTRAAGMAHVSRGISDIAAPLVAGYLVLAIGLVGVLLIDLATFLVAVGSLVLVRIPRPAQAPQAGQPKVSLWQDMIVGWNYLLTRPGLAGFFVVGGVRNFFVNAALVLTFPMVLSFADTAVAGSVLSVGAAGLLAGGLVMSLWGGPGRRVAGAFSFMALEAVAFIVTGWLPNAYLIAVGQFLLWFNSSGEGACHRAIIQSKVPAYMQGRVFSAIGVISLLLEAPAYPVAGFLADRYFEPWMAHGGVLADVLGLIIGSGPGRGMGLLNIVMGCCLLGTSVAGYLHPRIRRLEDELPDAIIQ